MPETTEFADQLKTFVEAIDGVAVYESASDVPYDGYTIALLPAAAVRMATSSGRWRLLATKKKRQKLFQDYYAPQY